MRWFKNTPFILSLVLLSPAAALAEDPAPSTTQAEASGTGDAETLAARAYEAYSAGNYAEALALYQQALQFAPAAALYFNVANIYDKKLIDPHLAIEFYRKSISATDTTPELTLKATARIQALQQDLTAKPAPTTPLEPKASEPDKKSSIVQADPGKGYKTAGGVIVGLGALTVGTGLVVGLVAKNHLDTARADGCKDSKCPTQSGVDAMHAAESTASVSTGLFIGGLIASAVGTAIIVAAPSKKESANAAFTVRITPFADLSRAGIGATGTF